jgi:hypothetical protein
LGEARYAELLEELSRHQGATDELALFTSETHPPLPLEVLRFRAGVLSERLREARRHGYRAGINVLATIGHHEENLPNSLAGEYQRMTALDGRVCLGSFCPNDERYCAEYVEPLYAAMAQADPDFIWVDDDVRLAGHHPIPAGCFCDRCLALYADGCGTAYTRSGLAHAFCSGAGAQRLRNRRAWLDHNRRTLVKLLECIERTVHAVRPGLVLGFMSGERFFEGYDFAGWVTALSGPNRIEVRWRPGGGFYADDALDGLVEKSHQIGRQVSCLPDEVVSIQSEIENFPYQRLKKAARTTALEAASHIAAGCTGAAFNVLTMYDEPLDEYRPLVAELTRRRPFLDLLAAALGRSKPVGVLGAWHPDATATHALEGEDWLSGGLTSAPIQEILQLGIPPAYGLDHARVTALAGDLPLAFSNAQIRRVLSSGAYLDGQALVRLHEMGYEEYTGFAVEGWVETDAIEELTDHPLNRPWVGRRRDARQSFPGWLQPAAVLSPRHDAARGLSRLVDYGGKEIAPCGSGVFENTLGGRICVAGYYPWRFLQNLSKAAQLKGVLRWLSRDSLDAYVGSYHRIALWARRPGEGGLAVALINASLDPAARVDLLLRTQADRVVVADQGCSETTVRAARSPAGPYRRFVLPRIPAWEMRLVVASSAGE